MKFKVKDDAGDLFEIEKIKAVEPKDAEPAPKTAQDAEDFTADEKKLMKKLLKHADELLELIADEDEENEGFSEDALEIGAEEAGEDAEVLEKDAVVDSEDVDDGCDGEKVVRDSKKSFGAIEKRTIVHDSEIERDDEISKMWKQRYGG